jgi:hypothetical protein
MNPLLLRLHGIGAVDFTDTAPAELPDIDAEARFRRWSIIVTLDIRGSSVDHISNAVKAYRPTRPHSLGIAGFALSGLALRASEGTEEGLLCPTEEQWRAIAALGADGLRYVTVGIRTCAPGDEVAPGFRLADLLDLLYANGVAVHLGDHRDTTSTAAADRLRRIVRFVANRHATAAPLFADLPPVRVVPDAVTDVLLSAAAARQLVLCVDFATQPDDALIRRVLLAVGLDRVVAVTSPPRTSPAGVPPALPYPGHTQQLRQLRRVGFTEGQIESITGGTARRLLSLSPAPA